MFFVVTAYVVDFYSIIPPSLFIFKFQMLSYNVNDFKLHVFPCVPVKREKAYSAIVCNCMLTLFVMDYLLICCFDVPTGKMHSK